MACTDIDSSVFLSYIAGPEAEPIQNPIAKAFFKSIIGTRKRGVLSYLTTMEILDVLRKWKGAEFDAISNIPSESDRVNYVIEGAKQLYAKVIMETLATPEFRLEDKFKVDTAWLLRTAFEILTDVRGVVRLYDECNKCGTKKDGQEFISAHKCAGTADMVHALLARELKCSTFVTFDKGFLDLINEKRIKPLRIEVLRPK